MLLLHTILLLNPGESKTELLPEKNSQSNFLAHRLWGDWGGTSSGQLQGFGSECIYLALSEESSVEYLFGCVFGCVWGREAQSKDAATPQKCTK